MNDQNSRQQLIEELKNTSLDVELWTSMKPHEIVSATIEAYLNHAIKIIESQPPAECVPLREIYRVIAGHSDYHGDNILAALTCIAAGKEVKPVRPLPADVPDTNVGEWIPCSERLPQDEQDVLGTTDEGIVEKVWYNKHSKTWYGSPFTRRKTVTAWMPLPEPYKGE